MGSGAVFTWIGVAMLLLALLTKPHFSGAPYFHAPRWVGNLILVAAIACGYVAAIQQPDQSLMMWLTLWAMASIGLVVSAYWGHRRVSREPAESPAPDIKIETQGGLLPPATSDEVQRLLRDHRFLISNNGKRAISRVSLRVQFPEHIVKIADKDWASGVSGDVIVKPLVAPPSAFSGTLGGRPATVEPDFDFLYTVPAFEIEIAELFPNHPVSFYVRSHGLVAIWIKKDGSSRPVDFLLYGSYQFQWRDEWIHREFRIPLIWDHEQRSVTAGIIDATTKGCPVMLVSGCPLKYTLLDAQTTDSANLESASLSKASDATKGKLPPT